METDCRIFPQLADCPIKLDLALVLATGEGSGAMQPHARNSGTVIALAGRRIDAAGAGSIRFPLEAVPLVRQRVGDLLRQEGARALVCSAACGADLIALEEAGRLGMRRRVVLPFAPAQFRNTSVIDRPGHWGPLFDRVIEDVRSAGDLVVLDLCGDKEAYARDKRSDRPRSAKNCAGPMPST